VLLAIIFFASASSVTDTPYLQIIFSFHSEPDVLAIANAKCSVGQFSTHTCGVGHPLIAVFGAAHLVRSKKNKYGLSLTLASRPHLSPCESVGTNSLFGSPCVNAYIPTPAHATMKVMNSSRQMISVHDLLCKGPLKVGSCFKDSPNSLFVAC